jgi:phenylalanyl-tRNA synthetase beta subunit
MGYPIAMVEEAGVAVRAWVIDRFEHPKSGRRAMTVRTELRSATREISRHDASAWCARVRDAVHSLWPQEDD